MGVNKVKFGDETLVDLTGDTVNEEVLLKGFTAHGANGEPIVGNFTIQNQAKTVSPTTTAQKVTPDSGYDGLKQVIVNGAPLEERIMNATTSASSITPNDGYYGMSKVTVNPILTEEKAVSPSTSAQNITPTNGKFLSKVTVNPILTEEKTVSPSTSAQNITPNSGKFLSKVTVNAIVLQEKTVSPSPAAQTVTSDSGKNGLSKVTVNAAKLQSKTVTPKSSVQTVSPDSGYYGLGTVSVAAAPSDINMTNKSWTRYEKNNACTFYGNQKLLIISTGNLENNLVVSGTGYYIKHFGDVIPAATTGGYAIRACYIDGNGGANVAYSAYSSSRAIHVLILN